MSATTSRRRTLAGLAAALVGGAIAVDGADARPALCRPAGRYCTSNKQCCNRKCRTGRRVPIASRNICDCDAPYGMCGKMCRDLSSDPNHCGACGNQIDRDTHRCCDGVGTPIDVDNCAACGDVCGPDDVCCFEGGCVDLRVDANNCGGCGNVCENGVCEDGECGSAAAEATPCDELGPDKVFCVFDVDGVNTYANCGIDKRLKYVSGGEEAVTCETNADCADAFGPCSLADVDCICGTHAGVYPVGYESAANAYGVPALCVALTTNTSSCDSALIICSDIQESCSADTDCCHGTAVCSAGSCVLPADSPCNTSDDCEDCCNTGTCGPC